ncbi:DPEP2 neighbor protein-like [Suncus etruscus]|uniref:DPEP2 neighbor protein-like n=1 Tax=Suncus etruscus TaxID=109475 RepID=UPI00210FF45F|nr:DPEP2 neighbor protein-like [Suncus etruscus]
MTARILYIHSNMPSVPWDSPTAVVAPSTPSPGHYHILYRGYGESQVCWHGETYCMIGTYRTYGDIPLATPAKLEAEKPAPRRALKRHHTFSDSDIELGCSRPKIRRLQRGTKRQKLTG